MNREIKTQIIKLILKKPFLGRYAEYNGIVTFLSFVWDLKSIKSTDVRFYDMESDITQHMINNDDWSFEELFFNKLGILDDDENKFNNFVHQVIHPSVRESFEDIKSFVDDINEVLKNEQSKLTLVSYFEKLPIYEFRKFNDNSLPLEIPENTIQIFYKIPPISYPCFILEYDTWDDYGCKTSFNLKYLTDNEEVVNIGDVKIFKTKEKLTKNQISENFTVLDNTFCSLGQSEEYYKTLKNVLNDSFHSFLYGMRDAAFFPKIYEQFEVEEIFINSLIRENQIERMARRIRFKMDGINKNEYYKFNYNYRPQYSNDHIIIPFNFDEGIAIKNRIYCFIGKNGAGKTNLLSSLAKELGNIKSDKFFPIKPIYSKIFTISYSIYDRFEIPFGNELFNYTYCGLKKRDGSIKNTDELIEEFTNSSNKIISRGLFEDWRRILENFLPPDIIEIISIVSTSNDKNNIILNPLVYKYIKDKLSSGQSAILYSLTEILAKIRYDSIILFDEPETHLHPNAISNLINSLFLLVEKFESYCIIATHSPIVVREISSKNVFVLERIENNAYIRNLSIESLGENLTSITNEVFGNKEVIKHFEKIIQKLKNSGYSNDQIIKELKVENIPLSENLFFLIKSLE